MSQSVVPPWRLSFSWVDCLELCTAQIVMRVRSWESLLLGILPLSLSVVVFSYSNGGAQLGK